jgi:aspartate aminotransferase
MRLAQRVARIGESATLKVSRRAGELARQGVPVIDFGAGEPDFDCPPVAGEAARRGLAGGVTPDTPARGLRRRRGAHGEGVARGPGGAGGGGGRAG